MYCRPGLTLHLLENLALSISAFVPQASGDFPTELPPQWFLKSFPVEVEGITLCSQCDCFNPTGLQRGSSMVAPSGHQKRLTECDIRLRRQ